MTEIERKKAAKAFADYWKDKGYEKGESQPFWLSLLRDVLGIEHPEQYIKFEDQVMLDHTSFIDGSIEATHVLIEQKGVDKDLRKPIKQSDGSLLTPFQQAKRYAAELPYSKRPRWIVACNFKEFLIYDMEKPTGEPESILLSDLPKEYYRLQFLVEEKSEFLHREEQISIQAGELVGKLYSALLKEYADPENEDSLRSLNKLCVRLVFCLYAEDAGIFGEHLKFHNYVKKIAEKDIEDVREGLVKLFKVLDQPLNERSPYLKSDLASFPYVNGGLFADEDIEIPNFTPEIVDLLLHKASENFDWSQISPTIFGAVFESTLNPETRREGGMHYTSIENIHKVIDPLFLDELREELDAIKAIKVLKNRKDKLEAFRQKLAGLTFFDPACGSGNFLTETYISLRRLENEALRVYIDAVVQVEGQMTMGFEGTENPILVSIGQFYGIEINDFAVTVATTALWIAESQMMKETEELLNTTLDFLPLKSYTNIVEGNALRIDWESVVPKDKLNYIMGNPPFVGFSLMTAEQKNDVALIFPKTKNVDYVACWYMKALKFINNTSTECAFVSTNSICQGEIVPVLWTKLLAEGIVINFAYRTFVWKSEAKAKAAVHCIIIGFAVHNRANKVIYDGTINQSIKNINPYLLDSENIIVYAQRKPFGNIPAMVYGNKPADGGNLIIEKEEYDDFIAKEPNAKQYIRKYVGAVEFLHNEDRYCLWLKGANPKDLKGMPLVMKRIEKCKEMRNNSVAAAIRKFADTPTLFAQITQPEGKPYIIVPAHSSASRKYIPLGFVSPDVISSNAVFIIPEATVFQFGILMSNVHNAWMRATCGRIKSDYRYSKEIVYNCFPWPTPTNEQKAKIEQTAQAILDARALYPDCSLADLYDEVAMPPELRKAHQQNDRAVMQAYGFDVKTMTESECVAKLMGMYEKLTSQNKSK